MLHALPFLYPLGRGEAPLLFRAAGLSNPSLMRRALLLVGLELCGLAIACH
jgi:hypothetical protein